jgi:thiamine-monophosphate kinase
LERLADISEFGFLSRILQRLPAAPDVLVGAGQDCAAIRCGRRPLLLTVDALVEGVHFETGWMSARQLGRKSFLVNASDVAAMGGRPRVCLVSLGVPPSFPAPDLFALQAGIVAAARAAKTAVVGGNLTRAAQLWVSVTLLAEAPKRIVTRQGARPGDRIYVTGTLGDAAAGVRHLRAGKAGHARGVIARFREPSPRLRAGRLLVESGIASAMIDVSDGLVQDLGHICAESRVGARIDAHRVPLSKTYRALVDPDDQLALHGGEDYELLCTVAERNVPQLERSRSRLGCPITHIGEITSGRGVRVLDAKGGLIKLQSKGHDHFPSPG